MERQQDGYIIPPAALQKLRTARTAAQTVYIYGATGFGKTELLRHYLNKRHYTYLSCAQLPWANWPLPKQQRRKPVVLDDLHLLHDKDLQRQILELCNRPDIWLLLASRSPLPNWLLPTYVKHGFIIITEDNLRLGKAEISAQLADKGLSCTDEELQFLATTSQGNAYIMRHVVLSLQSGKHVGQELYQEIQTAFAEYLENNVINYWEPDLLDFLLQICVVDEFTLEMAELISGNSHVLALLEKAAETGNFLNQEGPVYRLRYVLLKALRRQAEKRFGPQQQKDCAYRAGLYYAMQGEILLALKMFERSGNRERIKELLIRNARLNPGNGHYWELRHYYLGLEEAEIAESPVLMSAMSMLHSLMLNPQTSELWYNRLKAYTTKQESSAKREAQVQLAYLDIALPHRGSRGMVGIMKAIPGLLLDKGLQLPEFSVTSNLPSTMNGGKDFCHWSPYDHQLAASIGGLVERILGRGGKGLVKAALGESLYEKGEDTYKVLSLLSRAQLETENGGLPEIAFAAVGVRVRLMLLADDVEAARDILAAFTAAVQEQNANQLLPNIQALQCRLALYSGDAAGVANWLNKAPNEDKEFCVLERYRYLTKVRCYIARGEHLRALALLEKLHYYAEICKRPYVNMECGLLTAIVKHRLEQADWQAKLLPALKQACGFGFIRLISEEGAAIQPLLQQLAAKNQTPPQLEVAWWQRLLKETETMARRYPLYLQRQAASTQDFCTQALQILRLQADGLSVKQIAEQLEIKPNTVKYHIKENYRKLGVSDKTGALLAARGLGLI